MALATKEELVTVIPLAPGAFEARQARANKKFPHAGDFAHAVDVIAAVLFFFLSWYRPDAWLLAVLAFLSVWHVGAIAVGHAGLLWFDDLLDAHRKKDPRVLSFRRTSLHVLLQIGEVILLFTILYRAAELLRFGGLRTPISML